LRFWPRGGDWPGVLAGGLAPQRERPALSSPLSRAGRQRTMGVGLRAYRAPERARRGHAATRAAVRGTLLGDRVADVGSGAPGGGAAASNAGDPDCLCAASAVRVSLAQPGG